ncbi:MAG: hypothetical protein AAF386_12005, partial [Pseudomonadota bacterium]
MFPFQMIWAFTWRIGLVACLLVAGSIFYFAATLPPALDQVDGRAKGSVTLLDNTGEVFAWRGDQFGGIVT